MARLFIHVRDAVFHSRDDGAEYDEPTAALTRGVQGAMDMASEEIGRGERSTALEVSVEQEDGTQLLRSIVAVSVSPLVLVSRP